MSIKKKEQPRLLKRLSFLLFFFDMENTVLWLAYKSKEIYNLNWTSACISTSTSASKDCIALFKFVFV